MIDLTSPTSLSSFSLPSYGSARTRVDNITAEGEEMVQRIQARCVKRAGYTRVYNVDTGVAEKVIKSPGAKVRLVSLSDVKYRQIAVDVCARMICADLEVLSQECSDAV